MGNTLLAPSLSERVLMKPKLLNTDLQGTLKRETSSPPPKGSVVLTGEYHTKSQLGVVVWINNGELVTDDTADNIFVLTNPTPLGVVAIDVNELGVKPDHDTVTAASAHRLNRGVIAEARSTTRHRARDRLSQDSEFGWVFLRGGSVSGSTHRPANGGSGGNGVFPIHCCRRCAKCLIRRCFGRGLA